MAKFVMRTRDHGVKIFDVADCGGMVHVVWDSYRKPLAVCGEFYGVALLANPDNLPDVARKWWKARLRKMSKDRR